MQTPQTPAPEPATAELQAQLRALVAENTRLKLQNPSEAEEDFIAGKMRAGLTRKQAIEVLGQQRANDARLGSEKQPA